MTKDQPPDTREDVADDPDAWVREGLKALREQAPSDASKRATLAQLGIGDAPGQLRIGNDAAAPGAPARASATGRTLLRWLLWGALLGALALVLQRWLG